MNKMSKKTEYALMALKLFHELDQQSDVLNQQSKNSLNQLISAKDVSDRTHTPYDVIARVLQVLSSRGILKAEYGVMGGYQLAKNLSEVTVHELIDVLENSSELAKCLGSDHECDLSKSCTIVTPITNLNLRIQNFYKSITLAEVLHV